jgi:hypothetical protein
VSIPCDNCGKPAEYAADEGNGNYCSYWCNLCIELRCPDGISLQDVHRLDQRRLADRFQAAAGSATPTDLRSVDDLLTPSERDELRADLTEMARLRRRAEAEARDITLGTAAGSATPEKDT